MTSTLGSVPTLIDTAGEGVGSQSRLQNPAPMPFTRPLINAAVEIDRQPGTKPMEKPTETLPKASLSDYLAAERTLLAWIRTGLALMGFGFVVARFGLFLQQLQIMQSALPEHSFRSEEHTSEL